MKLSFNKIQEIKSAIKNSEQVLKDDLQHIQSLQNTLILNQQKMRELETQISDFILQEDIYKKKNGIIKTNIDHIQKNNDTHSQVIEQLMNSFVNSQNNHKQLKDKHQEIQVQINEIESIRQDKQEKMDLIMSEFQQVQKEKLNLTDQFNQLQEYYKAHFELSNKSILLEKQVEFLQQQLKQCQTIREHQEKQINILKYENMKYKKSISENKNKNLSLTKCIDDFENQLFSLNNEFGLSQISEDYLQKIQKQISLTDDQINLLKTQKDSIEQSLSINIEDHDFLESIDIDDLTEKAEKMQKELHEDQQNLYFLLKEREDLQNNEENMKFYTIENQQKLAQLQKLHEKLNKLKSRDYFYQNEISELREKSEKLEIDLNSLEESMARKKFEQDEMTKRIQINQDLKVQHENIMKQIQSKFKSDAIKVDQEKIDMIHKENKELMKKILKFADALGPKKIKKKKIIKKKPFIL